MSPEQDRNRTLLILGVLLVVTVIGFVYKANALQKSNDMRERLYFVIPSLNITCQDEIPYFPRGSGDVGINRYYNCSDGSNDVEARHLEVQRIDPLGELP